MAEKYKIRRYLKLMKSSLLTKNRQHPLATMHKHPKTLILLFLLKTLMSNDIFSSPYFEKKFIGSKKIENRIFENFNFAGFTSLNNCKIGNLCGAGHCEVIDSEIRYSIVSGHLILFNSIIWEKTQVTGYLLAEKTRFHDQIAVCSNKVNLKNCQTNDITFFENNQNEREAIYLKNTKVNGKIYFRNGMGKVFLDKNSEITNNVIGGTVEHNL